MFDLDKAIAAWRRSLSYNRAFVGDDLDELEQRVRDQVEGLRAEGMSGERVSGSNACHDTQAAEHPA